jgi:hypothetical protein
MTTGEKRRFSETSAAVLGAFNDGLKILNEGEEGRTYKKYKRTVSPKPVVDPLNSFPVENLVSLPMDRYKDGEELREFVAGFAYDTCSLLARKRTAGDVMLAAVRRTDPSYLGWRTKVGIVRSFLGTKSPEYSLGEGAGKVASAVASYVGGKLVASYIAPSSAGGLALVGFKVVERVVDDRVRAIVDGEKKKMIAEVVTGEEGTIVNKLTEFNKKAAEFLNEFQATPSKKSFIADRLDELDVRMDPERIGAITDEIEAVLKKEDVSQTQKPRV